MGSKSDKKKRFKNGRNGRRGVGFTFQVSHRDFFQETSAEREDRLEEYYVDNMHFESAVSPQSKKAFFVGRTGVGKTAILEMVQQKTKDSFIRIDPEDFAFKIIARSHILERLTFCNINLDLFYKTMWKYIFVTEILKQVYGNRRKGWMEKQIIKLRELSTDPTALRVYQFLLDNEELERGLAFNERIEKIVKKLEKSVEAKIDIAVASASLKLSGEEEKSVHDALKEFEFTDINYFFKHLDDDVLKKYSFVILVDDLDKNWIQNKIGVSFTRCLFETIFDINNSKSVRLLVSLRTNLFNQLELNQREKFTPYINYVYWKENELKRIVEHRFKAIGLNNSSDIWNLVFTKEITVDNGRKFKTFEYIMKRCNMRPRDMFFFISYAIESSIGKNNITQQAILSAETKYSQDRLSALEDEWKNPYLDMGRIFSTFTRCRHKLSKEEFHGIIDNITVNVLLKEEAKSIGNWSWIIEGNYIDKETFDSSKIVNLLYTVGFIGIKEYPSAKVKYVHDELSDMPQINDETRFYINPCYHKAIHVSFHEK